MTLPLTFTIQIAGTTYDTKEGSFDFNPQIEQRSKLTFTVLDPNNAFNFVKGQQITLTDSASTIQFTGTVHTSVKYRVGDGNYRQHDIDCNDLHQVADERSTNRIYTGQYAGVIFAGMTNDVLSGDGITANYAIREDNTQAEFAQGTLAGTVSTSNLGGDLELSLAGNAVTITENITSDFSAGTLTNMTAANNAVGPSATSAMKIQATQSVAAVTNSYTYMQFWTGSITVVSGRYFTYDIWISSSSPEAKIAVDLIFTDGSSVRDNAISNNGQYFDSQNKGPHPGVDLSGLAVDQWYHRSFLMDTFVGKTIAYAMIAIEGDKFGEYTGYVKNVVWLDSGGGNHGTFFSGSLGVNPPKPMLRQGYGTTSVTVVGTYDCSTAQRVSPAYNIDPVKIMKSSFLNFNTTLPTGYTFSTSYSIDGGNSYTSCVNNAVLLGLLAGLSVSGKTIQFLQSFDQGAGASPEQQPTLNSVQLILQPSYSATKSDVNAEFTTNGQWNTSGTSFTGCQAPSNILEPFGAVRGWDDGVITNQTLYGGGALGPNQPNSCFQYVDSKQFRMEVHQSTEGKSRMDFAGTWQNFQMEFDVSVDNTFMKVGCFYLTTGLSHYDGTYAYAVEVIGTSIKLFRGSNNAGATSNFGPTQVGPTATVALTSQSMHRIKIVKNGSTHNIYFDDTLAISTTDSTYSAAGYVGFRISNTSTTDGYIGTFDNFGISPTSIASGNTWTSQSVSLTGASTYLNSIVQWLDVSTDPSQVANTVQSSINGGSTWQLCTNGGPIPNLTQGQSLSGISVLFQVNFSANSSTVLPMIQYLTAYVLGGFSSSGTRISPALSLANALIAGNTVTNWSAITPPGTSVTVATSPTGTGSWTNVNNGSAIAGITGQPLPLLDTFDADDHLNYVHLQRTGGVAGTWTWDTASSRVTASGGTNDMQLSSPVWFSTGYGYKKKLTIDHTQVVGGSDLSSFPVLVHIIDPNLANVANRGLVNNINGFDIIFVNSAESGSLSFEIESYDPVLGEIVMWVNIATVSHTVDTVFYMYFGNASISTSQEAVTSVWDSNFKLVMHAYDNAASTLVNDSTSNANDGASQQNTNALTVSGQIGRSLSYNGTSDYVNVPNAASLDTVTTLTYSFWINPSAFNQASFASAFGSYGATIIDRNEDGGMNGYIIGIDTTGRLWWWPAGSQDKFSTATIPLNQWTHVAVTYSSSTVIMYINGVQDSSQSSVTPQAVTNPLRIGGKAWITGFFQGDIDEVHYSNIVRTPGWLGTEYNNQSNPNSFYSVGPLIAQPINSNKDIDLIVDTDQLDRGGLVWRQQDASNFYGLDIYDSSSNAGLTNVIQLYKVVANVKTQIGSNVAISFIRGTLHRFHVLMVGTSIKVYMDDNINTLINTTDSSLAGPGKAGLIEASGTAHFYNIRIQPQGQSLSGVNAFTRITLNSIDPISTPQVTNLTLAALHPNIGLGAYIPTADYRRTLFSSNADDLSKKSDYYWQIDPNKKALFGARVAQPAPWILTSNDILFTDDASPSTLSVENSGDLYRNRMILKGVINTQLVQEKHPGDGSSTSWSLEFPVASGIPTITVNNQPRTIGQKGIDSGKDFYFAYGSTSLAQDASGTLLQPFVDSFTIGYVGQGTTEVVRNNTGGFPGTTTQAGYAALTGGAGIVEVVEDVSSQNLTVAAAQSYGDGLLQRFGVIGRTFLCMTNRTGLSVGQYIPVFVPELGINDASMLITAMDLKPEITLVGNQVSMLYYWSLTLLEGPSLGSWQKTLLQSF